MPYACTGGSDGVQTSGQSWMNAGQTSPASGPVPAPETCRSAPVTSGRTTIDGPVPHPSHCCERTGIAYTGAVARGNER